MFLFLTQTTSSVSSADGKSHTICNHAHIIIIIYYNTSHFVSQTTSYTHAYPRTHIIYPHTYTCMWTHTHTYIQHWKLPHMHVHTHTYNTGSITQYLMNLQELFINCSAAFNNYSFLTSTNNLWNSFVWLLKIERNLTCSLFSNRYPNIIVTQIILYYCTILNAWNSLFQLNYT